MVGALYAVIIVPIVFYLIFTGIEIWLTFKIARRPLRQPLVFTQASTEVTHTLLVFSYAQFMVTHAQLLVSIGAALYLPVAIFMGTLLLRGSLYLCLFYLHQTARWVYHALLLTYVAGLMAIVWGLFIVVTAIIRRGFSPDTTDLPLILGVGLPALVLFMIPMVLVYRHAFAQITRR